MLEVSGACLERHDGRCTSINNQRTQTLNESAHAGLRRTGIEACGHLPQAIERLNLR